MGVSKVLSVENEHEQLGLRKGMIKRRFQDEIGEVCVKTEAKHSFTGSCNSPFGDVMFPSSVCSGSANSVDAIFEKQKFKDKSRGRRAMQHPTLVYGEITRPWTPVFALLEHKYIDKKDKTELGKPKRRGVLIPDGLIYGRPNGMRDGGSSEALHGWPTLNSTSLPFSRKEKQAQRDFMSLNKAAVSAGLVTAQDQYQFRATHDVRRKTENEDNQRNRTRRMPPSMVFGISTRPSTPIFDLLEHKYQDKWLQQRRQLELAKRQEENKARPSLQTFRSAKARESAYDHFDSDKISRKGNFGHGVFEAAKN